MIEMNIIFILLQSLIYSILLLHLLPFNWINELNIGNSKERQVSVCKQSALLI